MPALRGTRRIGAALGLLAGALASAIPAVAMAQEERRALGTPLDSTEVIVLVALGLAGLLLAASILFLYRRQRGLRWDYQLPDGALSEGQLTNGGDEDHPQQG